jgi:hypothetical protein
MAIEHDVLRYTERAARIEEWRNRFVSKVGIAKYRRAAAWAMDETAKHAAVAIRGQFHKTLKSQVPWTQQPAALLEQHQGDTGRDADLLRRRPLGLPDA